MTAIALGLGSSVLWGLADFFGGLKSRSFPVPVVLASMYLASLLVMSVFVAVRGDGPPDGHAVRAALGAGLVGIAALSAFYRALAIGTMSIVAPVAATGVALPVIVGIVGGDSPGVLRSIGLAAAVVGIVLASREEDGGPTDRRQARISILLALVAGSGFGSYFVLAEIGASGDVAWSLLLSRMSGAPIITVVAVVVFLRLRGAAAQAQDGALRRPRLREFAVLAGLGLLDLGANVLYNYASTIGELSSVAVASSLYPVTTVLLAAIVLRERIQGIQRAGVAVALAGVLFIAAG